LFIPGAAAPGKLPGKLLQPTESEKRISGGPTPFFKMAAAAMLKNPQRLNLSHL
jgi:hypothetical protein